MGTQLIEVLFRLVNTDDDNCLSLSEFVAIDLDAIADVVIAASTLILVDADGNGSLSVDEVVDALGDGGLSDAALMLLTGGETSATDIAALGYKLGLIIKDHICDFFDF